MKGQSTCFAEFVFLFFSTTRLQNQWTPSTQNKSTLPIQHTKSSPADSRWTQQWQVSPFL